MNKTMGRFPKKLQEIELSVVDQNECRNIFKNKPVVQDTFLCTYAGFGRGLCFGDSGSPLVDGNEQIGITFFAVPCARGFPDMFTRVYPYIDWIKNKINDYENKINKNFDFKSNVESNDF